MELKRLLRSLALMVMLGLLFAYLGATSSLAGSASGAAAFSAPGEATAEVTAEATAQANSQSNGQWQITIESIGHERQLQDVFLDSYFPQNGSAFLTVETMVKNLVFDPAQTLPDSDQLIDGISMYSRGAPSTGAFSLKNVVLRDSNGRTYSLAALGIGSDVLVAPNLTSFSLAAPEEEVTYTFIFDVPDNVSQDSLALVFENVPALPLSAGALASGGSVSATPLPSSSSSPSPSSTTSPEVTTENVSSLLENVASDWKTVTTDDGAITFSMPANWVFNQIPVGVILADSEASLADATATPTTLKEGEYSIFLWAFSHEIAPGTLVDFISTFVGTEPPITSSPYTLLVPNLILQHMNMSSYDSVVVYAESDQPTVPVVIGQTAAGGMDTHFELMTVAAYLAFHLNESSNASATSAAAASDCTVSTASSVNKRSGPGTSYAVAGRLQAGQTLSATGQFSASDGFTWWQLEDGTWVRANIVTGTGNCEALPTVSP